MAKKRKSAPSGAEAGTTMVAQHRRARFEFEILEEFECGIQLQGTEVKVLRDGNISLEEAYARIIGGEVFLVGAHIDPYNHASVGNHNPTRRRKLLLRRAEIRKLEAKVTQKGLTLVPLAVYFNARGLCKVKIGLGRGKKGHDKRQTLKGREDRREIQRFS